MAYCKQQGQGKDRVVTQGEVVTTPEGLRGEIVFFNGGSHQWATIRTQSGYTYSVDTREVT